MWQHLRRDFRAGDVRSFVSFITDGKRRIISGMLEALLPLQKWNALTGAPAPIRLQSLRGNRCFIGVPRVSQRDPSTMVIKQRFPRKDCNRIGAGAPVRRLSAFHFCKGRSASSIPEIIRRFPSVINETKDLKTCTPRFPNPNSSQRSRSYFNIIVKTAS